MTVMEPVVDNNLQEEVLNYLGRAAAHGSEETPRRIDTHCSVILLAGENVYKVKRAVKFPFLDYSTLERRKHFCEREYEINRRFAPNLYKGVVAITRSVRGFSIGGPGEVVEWAVHLRRFDENATFDRLAQAGALSPEILRELAVVISRAHADAKVVRNAHATEAMTDVIEETLAELAHAPHIFATAKVAALNQAMRSSLRDCRGLLTIREATGHVRRCHGDLHLRNIVLLDEGISLFDAIEFDEAIATIDVLYDLAFLLMDLWEKNLALEANTLLNRYLWRTEKITEALGGLAVLPLFLSVRAAIRAKIEALGASPQAGHRIIAAQQYFEVARAFLKPDRPLLIAIGGRSGTGKSTLAAKLAPFIGRAPGAIHLRSDIERKRQFNTAETTRLPRSAYSVEVTAAVYEALEDQATIALRSGQSVIVDATFLAGFEANSIAKVARGADADFRGIWLDAATGLLMRRLALRTGDASDATPDVLRMQPSSAQAPAGWFCVDASRAADEMHRSAMNYLGLQNASFSHLVA